MDYPLGSSSIVLYSGCYCNHSIYGYAFLFPQKFRYAATFGDPSHSPLQWGASAYIIFIERIITGRGSTNCSKKDEKLGFQPFIDLLCVSALVREGGNEVDGRVVKCELLLCRNIANRVVFLVGLPLCRFHRHPPLQWGTHTLNWHFP